MDVRKFVGDKPTPKGLCMKPELFSRLVANRERLMAAIAVVKNGETDLPEHIKGSVGDCWRDPEGAIVMELDKYHKCKIYKFKGMLLVDVRQFFKDNPTKKGISMAPEIFDKITSWTDWESVVNKIK